MEVPEADTRNNVDIGNSPTDKEETAMETVMQAQSFPHLLELIGKKMDVEDLWKLRQTCFTWNKEFLPALRGKQKPVLLSCDWNDVIRPTLEQAATSRSEIASASSYNWNIPSSSSKHTLRSYTNVMRSSKAIPAAKYILLDINSKPSRLLVLADFFQLCGAYITHLELWANETYNNKNSQDPVDIVSQVSLRQIIFHQVPNLEDLVVDLPYMPPDTPVLEAPAVATRDLPQLRTLSFRVQRNRYEFNTVHGLHSLYRSLLTDLIRSTTGLNALEFGGEFREWSALEAIRLVREVMSEEQVSKLKTLVIGEVRAPHLEILLDLAGRDRRKKPLRLKYFFTSFVKDLDHLEMVDIDETCQLLFRFLQSQADTLLELNFNTIMKHASTINFPIMPAVRNLSLELQMPTV